MVFGFFGKKNKVADKVKNAPSVWTMLIDEEAVENCFEQCGTLDDLGITSDEKRAKIVSDLVREFNSYPKKTTETLMAALIKVFRINGVTNYQQQAAMFADCYYEAYILEI